MEQKSNVQLNSKCKIIDISQKYSCRGNPNFLFGETTQNRCGKTPERYCAPQVAAAYYSGGIIQILRYLVTSSSQGRQAAQYDI